MYIYIFIYHWNWGGKLLLSVFMGWANQSRTEWLLEGNKDYLLINISSSLLSHKSRNGFNWTLVAIGKTKGIENIGHNQSQDYVSSPYILEGHGWAPRQTTVPWGVSVSHQVLSTVRTGGTTPAGTVLTLLAVGLAKMARLLSSPPPCLLCSHGLLEQYFHSSSLH